MSLLVIAPDATWWRERSSAVSLDVQLRRHLHGGGGAVPLTPSACMWLAQQDETGRDAQPNALASAMVAFLQLPVRQLRGTACITGWCNQRARPLSTVQDTAFAQVLRAVQAMPAYLSLHAQAGRVAAAWHSTDDLRSTP